MSALIANTRLLATEELTLGMIAFQRTNSMPAAVFAISINVLQRASHHLLSNNT